MASPELLALLRTVPMPPPPEPEPHDYAHDSDPPPTRRAIATVDVRSIFQRGAKKRYERAVAQRPQGCINLTEAAELMKVTRAAARLRFTRAGIEHIARTDCVTWYLEADLRRAGLIR